MTITIQRYQHIDAFYQDTHPYLASDIATHSLIYASVERLRHVAADKDDSHSRLYRVIENQRTVGIGLITTPLPARALRFSCDHLDAVENLVAAIKDDGVALTAIYSNDAHARHMGQLLGAPQTSWALVNYHLNAPPAPTKQPGILRAATLNDLEWLVDCRFHFRAECSIHQPREAVLAETLAELKLPTSIVWLWEIDGKAVSTAIMRNYPLVSRIGFVYTPPEFRGCGHAHAMLATLCREAMRQGVQEITLDAEAHNAVSNRMYQRLGFRVVSTSTEYHY